MCSMSLNLKNSIKKKSPGHGGVLTRVLRFLKKKGLQYWNLMNGLVQYIGMFYLEVMTPFDLGPGLGFQSK